MGKGGLKQKDWWGKETEGGLKAKGRPFELNSSARGKDGMGLREEGNGKRRNGKRGGLGLPSYGV
jgi:hypothetical protein